jgi:guanylate cyclase
LINKFSSCYAQQDFEKRARSLLVVAMSQPSHDYAEFTERVREYNLELPFNFTVSNIFATMDFKKVS